MKIEKMMIVCLLALSWRAQAQVPLCSKECLGRLRVGSEMDLDALNDGIGKVATGNTLTVLGIAGVCGSAIAGTTVGVIGISNDAEVTAPLATSIAVGVANVVLLIVGVYVSNLGHEAISKAVHEGRPRLYYRGPPGGRAAPPPAAPAPVSAPASMENQVEDDEDPDDP